MNRTFSSFWKTNTYETISGNFGANLLNVHTSQIAANRIFYSVNYPFVMMQQGQKWVENLHTRPNERRASVKGNAVKLLGLDK